MSTITVNGMHCQNCSNSVKEAMAKAGANNIVVDLEKKCVSWEGCLTKEQAKEIIDNQGFDAVL
ncbi:heavy-metal-associated domain-containing protein [Taurinivorans muris]|mgnify:CR=1 FL=1|uniref:Heavy-metal-associated domain-containing protein n=1 Tax=Taurinivorans muris TaxID=2787751 RepID=A0ABY5XZ37_9BACT|nr:heavy-metal-associated domain-containing protein [Mailhella sp.]UWX05160.1 heavy-metal-associated domain-containing protein [Desulfovibrionaceae bacterium LT0009]HBV41519.1 mercury transporter [Desulfovibrio sp.]